MSLVNQQFVVSYLSFHFIVIFASVHTYVKLIMSRDGKVESHIRYETFKRKIKDFLTPNGKLDELKAQLNK